MSGNCCDKAGMILSAECRYAEDGFHLRFAEGCLPDVFTVRFAAPADYKAGDPIIVKQQQVAVKTLGISGYFRDTLLNS